MEGRRWKGMFGLAAIWGAAWGLLGSMFGGIVVATTSIDVDLIGRVLQATAVGWAVNGAIAGTIFGALLIRAMRRRNAAFTARRALTLGALAGSLPVAVGGMLAASVLAVGAPVGRLAIAVAFGATLGLLSAGATWWLARRAGLSVGPSSEPPLIEAGRWWEGVQRERDRAHARPNSD